jgi:prolyl oligopeptidase
MHRNILLTGVLAVTLSLSACGSGSKTTTGDGQPVEQTGQKTGDALSYPETRREDVVDTIHGVEVADPYRWLEDVESDEVQQWMTAQDDVTRAYLEELPYRERLLDRFAELYYIDSISAPVRRGDRYFWSRRHADKEKRVYYWREGTDGEQQVLIDPNTLSDDGTISVGRVKTSWDGTKVAYTLKENNADEATLYVMDVASGEVSDVDVIPGAKYASPSWTPDTSGFYYTRLPVDPDIPVADRPGYAEIRYHELGTDPADDPVVHEKLGDPEKFIGVDLSRDGEHLFFYVWHGWNQTDVYYRNLEKGDEEWRPLVKGKPYKYFVDVHDDQFYIFTNEDAPRYRVLKTSAKKPTHESWEEIIGEFEDGSVIDNVQVVGGHLVLTLMKDVHADLRIHDLDGKLVRDIELPGIGASFGMTGNPDDDVAYFSFQSFTIPTRIYETKISTGKTELWEQVEVPIDPEPYKVEQVWYESKDGTKVPMFVVTRKDIELDGSTPFLLYGYGGFNVNMRPYFRASIYPWLEAGGGYAVPNLRGGGEFGEEWHKAGMLHNKQNVFDDFIAAAEYLVDNGYTSPDKLGIKGGSNGGLLVGAAMTQRPDLFGAVICGVPLLDMVRYHLFGSGKTWISEYGSADDAEQFETLYAYSPYHQVEKADYPSLLMMAADSDDRVDPMHARKFVAAVQHADTNDDPTLLRIERNAGHGGADLIRKYVAEDADETAFLMHELGLEPTE